MAMKLALTGKNLAVVGNSVGGNMTTSIALMAKEKKRSHDQAPGIIMAGNRCQFQNSFL